MTGNIQDLKKDYARLKGDIESRLAEFLRLYETGSQEDVFVELAFCLFTPQSKARSCWAAVTSLAESDLLMEGEPEEIAGHIPCVRFRNNKARYLVVARERFMVDGGINIKTLLGGLPAQMDARDWLVKNVKGLGLKEASHFLRNIGKGDQLAILDRHILKNLVLYGVIDRIPQSLSTRTYLDIEEKMKAFSSDLGIPMGHLDLLFWSREAGEIFK